LTYFEFLFKNIITEIYSSHLNGYFSGVKKKGNKIYDGNRKNIRAASIKWAGPTTGKRKFFYFSFFFFLKKKEEGGERKREKKKRVERLLGRSC
jgi:hypothetical protein